MSGCSELHLSLVIPAFNEAARLPESLRKIIDFSSAFTFPYEVLVIVEKSTDGTLELAREVVAKQPNFQIIDNEVQRGKGYAVRCGMLRARGEYVFYMDADLSVQLREVLFFLDCFRSHPEVDGFIGNRNHAESRILKRQSLLRRKMGRVFNQIIQLITMLETHDTQCGFKAFRNVVAKEIFSRQQLDGFAFDVEVLLLAEKMGFDVTDLPVSMVNIEGSKVSIFRDSIKMFSDAIRVKRMVDGAFRNGRLFPSEMEKYPT